MSIYNRVGLGVNVMDAESLRIYDIQSTAVDYLLFYKNCVRVPRGRVQQYVNMILLL